MAALAIFHPKPIEALNLALPNSKFLSLDSFSSLNKQALIPQLQIRKLRTQKSRSFTLVAAQSNFFKVLQTAYKVARDGIDAGTNLVPEPVPRPIAKISVTVVAVTVAIFALKSFLSTAFFVLATMGLVYSIFIAFNKDEGPKGGGGGENTPASSEDAVEEARRIMEKYK
ncbi:hypothetical protein UlMin_031805 [Ulmus minor]